MSPRAVFQTVAGETINDLLGRGHAVNLPQISRCANQAEVVQACCDFVDPAAKQPRSVPRLALNIAPCTEYLAHHVRSSVERRGGGSARFHRCLTYVVVLAGNRV